MKSNNRRTGHIASRKMPGITAWIVTVNGVKAGVVRMYADGMFSAVAGHEKLGRFDTKLSAVNAVAATVLS